jgi:FkbM family methyltransferase
MGGAATPSDFTAVARDIFIYEYTPIEGDVVVDVGAGVGAETLLFSRLVGQSGRVVSLEAHPATYQWLVKLCRLNDLANVTPLQIAASDSEGETVISNFDLHIYNTVVDVDDNGLAVPARRLDAVVAELGIERVDLLKMNIEGAERLALPGAKGMLSRTRHVCISCHDFLADEGGPEHMRTKEFSRGLLEECGFRLTTREDAPDPWTRDYLYGTKPS